VEVASITISAGAVTVGGVVSMTSASLTVTVCVVVLLFPAASVAVQVTVVTPTGKGPVLSGTATTVISTRSVASTVGRVTVVNSPVACTVMFSRVSNTGAVVSVMITRWVAVPVFPAELVELQTIKVSPTGKGPSLSAVTVCSVSISSVAVAVPIVTGVNVAVASVVMSSGSKITGVSTNRSSDLS